MAGRRVAVVPGDGIGPEVIGAACRVLDAAGSGIDWETVALDDDAADVAPHAVAAIRAAGVALKGPVATGRQGRRSPNVALRRALDLYVNVRPSRSWWPGRDRVDLWVVRETTEDLYRGVEVAAGSTAADELLAWLSEQGHDLPPGTGVSIKPTSAAAVHRAMTRTVALARAAGRRRITIVHKAGVLRATDGLFLDVAREVGASAGDLEVDDLQIDNLVAQLVRRPSAFDVLFMPNQYGDIVSDLAAAITGGIGLAPGVNHGDGIAVFESVHGTAPRHAGHGRANPLAAILSGALLLRHLGLGAAADRVEVAVGDVVRNGPHTYDLVSPGEVPVSTAVVADAVISRLG